MAGFEGVIARGEPRRIELNRVLKNTYMLLAATLLFSALMAGVSTAVGIYPTGMSGLILTLGGMFGLLFLTTKFRNSPLGLLCVFAFTGFMGFTLGPLLSAYLAAGAGQTVMTALGGTGIIFLALSGYVLVTKKDFSFIGGMLFIGIITAFLLGIAAAVFGLATLSLAVSAMFVLLMSGLILWQTSDIIHGGETNYIMATITLYMSIYNLFLSLLHLLSVFGGDD